MAKSNFIPRRHSRYDVETPIRIAKQNTENVLPANMLNISNGGMYFESSYEIDPHSNVCIWLEQKLRISDKDIQIYDFYRSRVLWCQENKTRNALGVGVQHVHKCRNEWVPEFLCSVCDDPIPLGKVHFVQDFVYLCPECYQQIESCSGKFRNEMLRFLQGNVF